MGVQGRDLPSAWLGGPLSWFKPCPGKAWVRRRMGGKALGGGCGAAGWKHVAGGGLRDVFNRYSQVKYQVVVALFGDAVVEPHCNRDRRVTGYA